MVDLSMSYTTHKKNSTSRRIRTFSNIPRNSAILIPSFLENQFPVIQQFRLNALFTTPVKEVSLVLFKTILRFRYVQLESISFFIRYVYSLRLACLLT